MCGERLWMAQPNVPGLNVLIAVCAKGPHSNEPEPRDENRTHEGHARVYRDNGQAVLAKITWVR